MSWSADDLFRCLARVPRGTVGASIKEGHDARYTGAPPICTQDAVAVASLFFTHQEIVVHGAASLCELGEKGGETGKLRYGALIPREEGFANDMQASLVCSPAKGSLKLSNCDGNVRYHAWKSLLPGLASSCSKCEDPLLCWLRELLESTRRVGQWPSPHSAVTGC